MSKPCYRDFTVDIEGKGDFSSLTLACAYLEKSSEPVRLLIHPGHYSESVVFHCNNLIIEGTGSLPSDVVISDCHYALEALSYSDCKFSDCPAERKAFDKCADCSEKCPRRGTFYTAVVRTDGDNIKIRNLTIINSAGNGKVYGQAIALYTDGNGQLIENCIISGHQDTIFTAPFPLLNKYGKNEGFGPKGNCERTPSSAIFRNCTISGDVDYIFGGATVLFDRCKLLSNGGYVTAPSTPENNQFGYLFTDCIFDSISDDNNGYFLGRPWRPFGKAVFIHSTFKGNFHKDLFDDWNNSQNRTTSFFAVTADCSFEVSPNSQISADEYLKQSHDYFGKLLNEQQAEEYEKDFRLFLSKFFEIF